MEEKMIERINQRIQTLVENFEVTCKFNEIENAHIDGMMEMLELATGKKYYFDKKGVHEQ